MSAQSLLIYWRENCSHSRTRKLLAKILILNNKDVMEQSLFALVTTDPGFHRPTPAWGQNRKKLDGAPARRVALANAHPIKLLVARERAPGK